MNTEKIKQNFIESGANLEHIRWAGWQKYMHSKLIIHKSGLVEMPEALFKRWERQIKTSYKDLSEQEKESDRKEARTYLPLLDKVLSQQREGIAEMIKGMKKMQTKHFSDGIEVQHHGKNPCTNECIPNGKEQGGQYNEALNDLLTNLTKEQ